MVIDFSQIRLYSVWDVRLTRTTRLSTILTITRAWQAICFDWADRFRPDLISDCGFGGHEPLGVGTSRHILSRRRCSRVIAVTVVGMGHRLWWGGHLPPMLRRYHGVAILEFDVKYVPHPDGWAKSQRSLKLDRDDALKQWMESLFSDFEESKQNPSREMDNVTKLIHCGA